MIYNLLKKKIVSIIIIFVVAFSHIKLSVQRITAKYLLGLTSSIRLILNRPGIPCGNKMRFKTKRRMNPRCRITKEKSSSWFNKRHEVSTLPECQLEIFKKESSSQCPRGGEFEISPLTSRTNLSD